MPAYSAQLYGTAQPMYSQPPHSWATYPYHVAYTGSDYVGPPPTGSAACHEQPTTGQAPIPPPPPLQCPSPTTAASTPREAPTVESPTGMAQVDAESTDPPTPSSSSGPSSSNRTRRDKSAPKHPLSAFLYFLKEMRPIFAKNNPGIRMAVLTKEMSKQWHKLTEADRSKYELMSMRDKSRYSREMDEWLRAKIAESS
jgi:hypothetical protein